MKLISARKFIKDNFEDDDPELPTIEDVRQWVMEESVPGKIISSRVYINADRFAICGVQYNKPAESPNNLTAHSLLE